MADQEQGKTPEVKPAEITVPDFQLEYDGHGNSQLIFDEEATQTPATEIPETEPAEETPAVPAQPDKLTLLEQQVQNLMAQNAQLIAFLNGQGSVQAQQYQQDQIEDPEEFQSNINSPNGKQYLTNNVIGPIVQSALSQALGPLIPIIQRAVLRDEYETTFAKYPDAYQVINQNLEQVKVMVSRGLTLEDAYKVISGNTTASKPTARAKRQVTPTEQQALAQKANKLRTENGGVASITPSVQPGKEDVRTAKDPVMAAFSNALSQAAKRR